MKSKKYILALFVLNFITLLIAMRGMWVSGIALDEAQPYTKFFEDNLIFIWGTLGLLLVSNLLCVYILFKKKS